MERVVGEKSSRLLEHIGGYKFNTRTSISVVQVQQQVPISISFISRSLSPRSPIPRSPISRPPISRFLLSRTPIPRSLISRLPIPRYPKIPGRKREFLPFLLSSFWPCLHLLFPTHPHQHAATVSGWLKASGPPGVRTRMHPWIAGSHMSIHQNLKPWKPKVCLIPV